MNGLVTLVDAVNAMGQLDREPEAVRQAAVADRIVITKTDLAEAATVAMLAHRLATMNLFAAITTAVDGELDPEGLANISPRRLAARSEELTAWIPAAPAARERGFLREQCQGATGAHDAAIRSFCLWFEAPFTWETLNAALQALTALRGPDLLRVKGIVHVAGEPGPVVLQGAGHLFHPPLTLTALEDAEPRSRIVFIVRSNIARESIEALFAAVNTLGR